MIIFQVDPSWYEHYWLRERPARCRLTVLSTVMEFSRQIVEALRRLQRANSPRFPAIPACHGAALWLYRITASAEVSRSAARSSPGQ